MGKDTQISMSQLVAILLTSRLVVSMAFAPTRHQMSHGTDFLLSEVLHMFLLLALLLPVWWFGKRTNGAGTIDYAYILFGRGGAVAAVLYAVACLYIVALDVLRFRQFVSISLSPDMSGTALCAALVIGAMAAAFYGLQAIARTATLVAFVVVLCIVGVGLALLPDIEWIHFPPLLYDGVEPVIAGAIEELPRTLEIAILGMLLPYTKGSRTKGYIVWTVLLTAVLLVIQATTVGVLGDFSEEILFPYYTAVTAAQVGVLQRMDIVATGIWVAALFLKMAFFCTLYMSCTGRLFGQKSRLLAAAIGGSIMLAAGLWLGNRSLRIEKAAIFWVSSVVLLVFAVALPLFLIFTDMALIRWKKKAHSHSP